MFIEIFAGFFFLPGKVNGHILEAVYCEVWNYPCKGHQQGGGLCHMVLTQ